MRTFPKPRIPIPLPADVLDAVFGGTDGAHTWDPANWTGPLTDYETTVDPGVVGNGDRLSLDDLEGNRVYFDDTIEWFEASKAQSFIIEREYLAGGRAEEIRMQNTLEMLGAAGVGPGGAPGALDAIAGHTSGQGLETVLIATGQWIGGDGAADMVQQLVEADVDVPWTERDSSSW